jgi:hypothetical protein
MPQVQQIVRYTKKEIKDLVTDRAKEIAKAGAGSSTVEFAWPSENEGDGHGKEEDVIATVIFNCNGTPAPKK